MKRTTKRLLAILLCLAVLPVEGFAVLAKGKVSEPPRYMRELSRLVAATASDDDFGEIQLTIGEAEIEVDGETQPIPDAPFVDENGEVQIPAVIFDDVPDDVGAVSPAELEDAGYRVQYDAQDGAIRITEPYGLCRLIVKTEDGKVRDSFGATHVIPISDNKTVLQYVDKETAEEAATLLRQDASVLNCAADYLCSVDTAAQADREYVCWGSRRAGVDTFIRDLPEDLPEIVVAVIDTGIDLDHPFLEGRLLSDLGWDFVNDDAVADDDHSHGTHCAGVIRDATPDNVKILPIKSFTAQGKGDNALCMESIRYAVDQGADIISMSWGGAADGTETAEELNEWFTLESETIAYAYDAGVTCIAAAGNESADIDSMMFLPANAPHVITVASIGSTDTVSYFSNYGSSVDLCAPGENIVSSVPDLTGMSAAGFQSASGTSMATPLVSACAALVKSDDASRSPDDVLLWLYDHAEDLGKPGKDVHYGMGCVCMRLYSPVTDMRMGVSHLTLHAFTSRTVQPEFIPASASNKTASYESSDPSVATVDDVGCVYARAAGSAVITAVSTDGGFRAQCAVTVIGSGTVTAVAASTHNILLRKNDGTVIYTGFRQESFGSKSFYFDDAWGEILDTQRNAITGIEQLWYIPALSASGGKIRDETLIDLYFTKADGLLYRLQPNGILSVVKSDAGEPLIDVVDLTQANNGVFALCADGMVWHIGNYSVSQVLLSNGSPLTNVRKIRRHAAFTDSGRVYLLTCAREAGKTGKYASAIFSYAKPFSGVKYAQDGFILGKYNLETSSFEVSNVVLLRQNGTVDAKGDNTFNLLGDPTVTEPVDSFRQIRLSETEMLTDVQAIHYNGFGVFALRTDGTVVAWGADGSKCGDYTKSKGYLGIGEDVLQPRYAAVVVQADGSPLTGVDALLPAYGARMLFAKTDGSVYISGYIRTTVSGLTGSSSVSNCAVPYTVAGSPMTLVPNAPAQAYTPGKPVRAISLDTQDAYIGRGDTIQLHAAVIPADADDPFVRYESANNAVAVVSGDGTVTGISMGTATIRVSAAEAPMDVFAECTVTVGSAGMQSVSIAKLPDKTQYTWGDALDTAGGELRVQLSDGAVKFLPLLPKYCSGFDGAKTGWQRVTASYAGMQAAFSVRLVGGAPIKDTLIPPDKTVYVIGQALDLTGGAVCAEFADGTQKTIPLTADMVIGFNPEVNGRQTLTVSLWDREYTFDVTVKEPEICGLVMQTMPDKTVYENETQLDPTGGSIAYLYDDGTVGESFPLTAEMCECDMTRIGERDVTVTRGDFSTTFPIEVRSVPGASLVLTSPPTYRCYDFYSSMKIDVRGAALEVRYADGTVEPVPITSDMCIKPDPAVITYQSWNITVAYYGLTTQFSIENAANYTVESIALIQLPYNTTVRKTQDFDPDGAVVRLYLEDGSYVDAVPHKRNISISKTSVGEKTATVKMYGKTATFPATVLPQFDAYLETLPDRTVYCLGESFSPKGCTYGYTGYYKDGLIEHRHGVKLQTYDCGGYDMTQLGEQTVICNTGTGVFSFPIYVTDMFLRADTEVLQCGQTAYVRPVYGVEGNTAKLTWTSSDESIAAVDSSGLVTAVSAGTVTITARASDICAASCTLTVQSDAVQPTALIILETPGDLPAGESKQLCATILSINAEQLPVKWASADPAVAAVDATGYVTGRSPGSTVITARIEGTDVTQTCTVTVTEGEAERIPGDADGDGEVTLKDVTQIVRYLAGGWEIVLDLANADVNGDGKADLKDVVLLRRYLAGWDVMLK